MGVTRRVIVSLCEPCIRGEGQECHTPGCVLFLHRVDIPFIEELLEDAEAFQREVAENFRARVLRLLEEWAAAYPESVWPSTPFTQEDLRAGRISTDRVAANMGRHMARRLTEQVRALVIIGDCPRDPEHNYFKDGVCLECPES